MSPESVASRLRAIAEGIRRSKSPSVSKVAAALREVLAAVDVPEPAVAAPATKVVISDHWTAEDLPTLVSEHKGTAVRQGYFGEYGIEMPADEAAQFEADVGEGAHVFNSWEDASKAATDPADPEPYEFEPVPGF